MNILATRDVQPLGNTEYLPGVLGENSEKRAMTKAELETFIDHWWRSHFDRLENKGR
jgi:hypothetical protein